MRKTKVGVERNVAGGRKDVEKKMEQNGWEKSKVKKMIILCKLS